MKDLFFGHVPGIITVTCPDCGEQREVFSTMPMLASREVTGVACMRVALGLEAQR